MAVCLTRVSVAAWLTVAAVTLSCARAPSGLTMRSDVHYGDARDWRVRSTPLRLDVIYPSHAERLPLIVYVHGGNFLEDFPKEGVRPLCYRLAREGFVVANLEYRLGFDKAAGDQDAELGAALYRAHQDAAAAIRYLIEHAGEYPFDPEKIFVAGESAGGFTALSLAYVNQQEWDALMPRLRSALGPLGGSGPDPRNVHIRGVINLAGGIANIGFISKDEMAATPVLLFHSTDDEEVPFEHASSPGARHGNVYGSRDIANAFKANGGCYQLQMVHEAWHGYGFSADDVATAVKRFTGEVLGGSCRSLESEASNANITLRTNDPWSPPRTFDVVPLTSDALRAFAGTYEREGLLVAVSVEGDHLKAAPAGQHVVQLYPVGEDRFMARQFDATVHFGRDGAGRVIEQVLDGRTFDGRRYTFHYRRTE